jgi:murein DD-endopeptidase MepM/ murein hydrolase activator NlpD
MAKSSVARRRFGGTGVWAVPIALLLAACGPRIGGPAPVISGEEAPPPMPPAQVTVQRGQTLSGIAHSYHVPMRVVAEANHLSPPYRIRVGQALMIPGGGEAASSEAPVALAALPPEQPQAAVSANPPAPVSAQPIPLDRRPPQSSARPPATVAPPMALTPPPAARPRAAETLPPPAAAISPREPGPPPTLAAPAREPPAAPGPSAAAEPPPGHNGGTFLWPVRGRVLGSYGAAPDGTHNDGINIAAPRGAAVQATDAGVVAYAGNELRGYGNLILVKHANGWISAYAHCDLMLVKPGQKVNRGQVIARVGSTGNVDEPQLHFELRRGKRAVDPRAYLMPPPTAATKGSHTG